MFIGYAHNNAVYRFLILQDEGISFEANTIIKTKNAKFFESIFPKKTSIEKQLSYTELTIDAFESSNVALRRSTWMRKATKFGDDFYVFLA